MLADLQVLSFFILYGVSLVLLINALPSAISILRDWNINSTSERQLNLERRNALVSVLMQYAIIIQLFLLFFFLYLVNVYLPQMLEGAMCASGVLNIYSLGYPALQLKIGATIIYVVFLFLNYLDQTEISFPFTPKKMVLFLFIFLLFLADFYMTLHFFSAIEPDIIATCCSSNFALSPTESVFLQSSPASLSIYLVLFYVLGALLILGMITLRDKLFYLLIILSAGFIYLDLIVLKFHFVKFIYEMPAHNCLFDIFWREYYYAGYFVFGSLALHFLSILLQTVYKFVSRILQVQRDTLTHKLRWISISALVFHLLLLSFYWIKWIM